MELNKFRGRQKETDSAIHQHSKHEQNICMQIKEERSRIESGKDKT